MDTSAKGASLIEESVMNVKTVAACNGQEDVINVNLNLFLLLKILLFQRYRAILDELIALGSRVGLINGFFEGSMFFVMYGLALLSLL